MWQESYVEALAAAGITRGCNPPANDRFCANHSVTRGEVASFLVRALDLPRSTVGDRFTDDDESPHETDIDSLVEAGITRGCNPPDNDKFCPQADVTRGEIAAFLVRAFGYRASDDGDVFADDEHSVFEEDIEALAGAGITSGCGEGLYCPRDPILRKNLAVFLVRTMGLDTVTPPARPRLLAEFTTYYKCCESRVTNIHLIANAVDGAVVEPGATWSLNEYVGKRTVEKGYVAAGVIVGGELVCCDHPDNIGGGTSQFATTLYNAVFFAGLEDVSHRPHSIYFSRYPLGHEATLGWTTPDLVFRNDTDHPLAIETSHTGTSVTVVLIGANGLRAVSASVSGSATTASGGAVTVSRVIRFQDGSSTTQTWFHQYNPLPPAGGRGRRTGSPRAGPRSAVAHAGIKYTSRLGTNFINWAVFDRAQLETAATHAIHKDHPSLKKIAKSYRPAETSRPAHVTVELSHLDQPVLAR
jgi:hypothetical protein